tara:strand:+ start:142 stop:429 length:288 start_codon:yes stop_codon:yes gene_type:complete
MGLFDNAKLVKVIDGGDMVCCDYCNGPYGDNENGGIIIGGSAICQECSDKYGYEAKNSNEIEFVMDKEKSFTENVLEYRKKMTGSTSAITKIYTM